MGGYIQAGGGTYTAASMSQADLLDRWEVDYVDSVFTRLVGSSLKPFIETISEVFSPPRSTGFHFYFKNGMRQAFVNMVYSKAFGPPAVKSLAMRSRADTTLVPDNPSPDPSATWRNIAAAKGIGTSFREPGTGLSLHVAFNKASCDVHVDRNGFVIRDESGNVYWDLNGLLRHFTVDLLSDAAPWLLVSGGVLDNNRRPILEATLSPWTAVDLPSRENGGKFEIKIGVLIGGKFDENRLIEHFFRK